MLALVVTAAVVLVLYKYLQPSLSIESLIDSAKRSGSLNGIEKVLASHDQKERLKAVQALHVLQTDEAIRLLERATEDNTILVRLVIVQGLQDLPEQKALPLISRLLDDREFGIVRDAISALEKHTETKYNFHFEATREEKAAIIAQCKRDISERLKQ